VNKIKTLLFLIVIFVFVFYDLSIISAEEDVILEYVHQFGDGENMTYAGFNTLDSDNNSYIVGIFQGTVDVDPGAGVSELTSSNSGEDMNTFFLKLDSDQEFVWVKQVEAPLGLGEGFFGSVITDSDSNLYFTGNFTGTVDFDPGAGEAELTAGGSNDFFILKLNSLGEYVWAKSVGGIDDDFPFSMSLDLTNNVYITGLFQDTVDFDPGAGTANLTAAGNYDAFILKLDEDGAYVWAKSVGGTSSDFGYSISIDSSGNSYITGYFSGTVDFDPGAGTANLTSAGNVDVFILKLDEDGAYVWAKNVGGADNDTGISITVDSIGNSYITGYFNGTADFDPGAGTVELTSAGDGSAFILKLNSSGEYVWAKNVGGTDGNSGIQGRSILLNSSNDIYLSGLFDGTADFDPGAGTVELTSAGDDSAFILKLNSLGEYVWVKQFGGQDVLTVLPFSFVLDNNDNIYIYEWEFYG
jgi:hypothetical protein